ncbi:MAG: CdaR family protein [Firmicutes bacterium]|nr:CdaR family protein [Bacillota bacterium]
MMDRLLENDTVLKILSVIVAIFIWIQAGAASTLSINRSIGPVAVGYSSINPHLTVLSINPATVTVQIKGPPSAVESSAMTSEVLAQVNLSGLTKAGIYSLKVSGTVPPGVGVVSVTPPRVVVTVARMGQQKVPVVIHVTGQPALSYQFVGYNSSLSQATIYGPTSALNQVRSVVGTLSIAGRTATVTSAVVLHPVNALGHVVPKVEVNPPTANVTATIQLKPPEKVLPVIGQLTGKPAAGYKVSQISVYPSTVILSGSKRVLASITHVYTIPVSVSGASQNITVAVPVVVPKGTTLASSGEVTITVTIAPSG